jgi:hypothetical protein
MTGICDVEVVEVVFKIYVLSELEQLRPPSALAEDS